MKQASGRGGRMTACGNKMSGVCGDCVYLNKCRNSVISKLPKTNIEWMRTANANDVARLIATKLCELARHEYGIYDVVDYATVFEWLKEKHDENT